MVRMLSEKATYGSGSSGSIWEQWGWLRILTWNCLWWLLTLFYFLLILYWSCTAARSPKLREVLFRILALMAGSTIESLVSEI